MYDHNDAVVDNVSWISRMKTWMKNVYAKKSKKIIFVSMF